MAQRSLRFGLALLASVPVAAPVLLAGFAAKARVHHPPRVHSVHLLPENTSTRASNQNPLKGVQKSEGHDARPPGRQSVGAGHGGTEGTAGSTNNGTGATEFKPPGMKDLGPVDTSNAFVRPHVHGAKGATTRVGASKINSKAGKYFHARHAFIQPKSRPFVRNTIGVLVPPHVVRQPASTGMKAGASGGAVKPGAGVGTAGVFHPIAGAGLSGLPGHGGAVSGTGFPHRGFAPATLGGQTKMTGGLSGSMIRPKY